MNGLSNINFISFKNTNSLPFQAISFDTPNIVLGSDSNNNPIETKITNSYINDASISTAKLASGSNFQILETISGSTQWSNPKLSDSLLTFFNGTDNTKIMTLDLSTITTGITRSLSMSNYNQNLTNPIFSSVLFRNPSLQTITQTIPNSLTPYTLTLPANSGDTTTNQFLKTDGTGLCTWSYPGHQYFTADNTSALAINGGTTTISGWTTITNTIANSTFNGTTFTANNNGFYFIFVGVTIGAINQLLNANPTCRIMGLLNGATNVFSSYCVGNNTNVTMQTFGLLNLNANSIAIQVVNGGGNTNIQNSVVNQNSIFIIRVF